MDSDSENNQKGAEAVKETPMNETSSNLVKEQNTERKITVTGKNRKIILSVVQGTTTVIFGSFIS